MSRRSSLSVAGTLMLQRQDSHADETLLGEGDERSRHVQAVLARRARLEAKMAALTAASARRAKRQAVAELAGSRPRSGRLDKLCATRREARRLEQHVLDGVLLEALFVTTATRLFRSKCAGAQEQAKCRRAMLRLAHPLNRQVVKEVLGLSDADFERADNGWDFEWERVGAGDFCCVCPGPRRRSTESIEDLGSDECSSDDPSRLEVEHSDSLPVPRMPDLRYGSGYEIPTPNCYTRLRERNRTEGRQTEDDRLLELCTELVDRLRDISLTGDTALEPRRLVQLLTVERDEGPTLAIDVQEMCTVPHETALRAFALHRSQREAVLRALRRDAHRSTEGRPRHPAVAFGRRLPGCKVVDLPRLAVKQPSELVNFDKVWCVHLLPLRITKRFCKFLEEKHPLVPRPRSLIQGGLLEPIECLSMMPATKAMAMGSLSPPSTPVHRALM